ncbi:MAG: helix-turn-helix transcriptional regulator [Monoglobaceae bacterium]
MVNMCENELVGQIEELCNKYGMMTIVESDEPDMSEIRLLIRKNEKNVNLVVRAAQNYIDENYSKAISLKDVSEYLYLSPNYFSELFKRKTGQRFIDYLNFVRVNKSKKILMMTGIKCYEAARTVGYKNPAYYSRVFKKFTGMTPKQYQSLNGISKKEDCV